MPGARYDISHAGEQDEVIIVAVHGYIDSTTSPELSKIIDQQLAQEKYNLIIDLKNVDYISSIGWGVFIGNLKEIRLRRGDLVLTNMCTNVHNIFDLMEMSSIIKSFDEMNKAIFYFLGSGRQIAYKKKASGESAGLVEPRLPEQTVLKHGKGTTEYKSKGRQVPIELVSSSPVSSYRDEVLNTRERLLENSIVKVILEKPFYSPRQIIKALRLPQYGAMKISKRKMKSELLKLGLENSENRYEFALKNRPR